MYVEEFYVHVLNMSSREMFTMYAEMAVAEAPFADFDKDSALSDLIAAFSSYSYDAAKVQSDRASLYRELKPSFDAMFAEDPSLDIFSNKAFQVLYENNGPSVFAALEMYFADLVDSDGLANSFSTIKRRSLMMVPRQLANILCNVVDVSNRLLKVCAKDDEQ